MGVKDVWHIAGPCEERISLHSLRGQTLAIDLAGWVVQNNAAPGMQLTVTRPHLRNIFFRVSTLLGLDILPVVVLDGAPPDLKKATVAARNQQVWGGGRAGPGQLQSPKRQQRRQFSGVLRDCERLLASLGVPCVTAPGEAEAYCAALNRAGLVDAVVSDDSDCFCYGARTVLRNFSTDPKSFSVSRYTAAALQHEVGLSRQRMVVMALLLGCDYNLGGVAGVGREAVTKLFSVWGEPGRGTRELDQVLAWSQDSEPADLVASKPVHCGTCGHAGSVSSHRKLGCGTCGTGAGCRSSGVPECDCDYHSSRNQALVAEWSVRRRAVTSPGWPFLSVVQEFYRELNNLPHKFCWSQPHPDVFVEFCVKKMDWLRDYCVEKILDTVVRWQVKNPQTALVSPVEIVKKRIKAGENMFEVQWTSSTCQVLPESFSACVASSVFSESYPAIFQEHLEMLEAKEAAKRKPKKKKDKENVPPKEKKTKAKKETKNQPTIEKFVKSDVNVCNDPVEELVKETAKVKLKPKNVILTKLISEDPQFNNKILHQKLVTPDTSDNVTMESFTHGDKDRVDSYVYRSHKSPEQAMDCHDSMMLSDSMKEYLEEDDDSDLSGIIDEIVGIKKSSDDNGLNVQLKKSFSTSTPSYNLFPNVVPVHQTASGSPMLRRVHENILKQKTQQKPKASDVFDMSDVSLVLEDCVQNKFQNQEDAMSTSTNKYKSEADRKDSFDDMHFSGEETFDEFDCLDNPSCTPLAERIRRNIK